MLLGMAFPNFLGLYLLQGKVRQALDEYMAKLRTGEFRH
jgi:AGCS family alanine or glycine:cation symporter